MKVILHKSDTRGYQDHGWLQSYHTFSFGAYQNLDRMNFGVLRVLNDDVVAQGHGFGMHSHRNMEIISIPLQGDLEHKDSMGNTTVIQQGDIQVMSAGTGIKHSEYNKSDQHEVSFLQIWIVPNKLNVQPRYDQVSLASLHQSNSFYQILSPSSEDQGVWVYQDVWFYLGDFDHVQNVFYTLSNSHNGVYIFLIEGKIKIEDTVLTTRDAIGISQATDFNIEVLESSKVLLMEVPLDI